MGIDAALGVQLCLHFGEPWLCERARPDQTDVALNAL